MDAVSLVGAEPKAIGEPKHVQGTRIAVELRGNREAHAAPSLQICELLRAQGLAVAGLETGVRGTLMVMLGQGGPSDH